MSESLIQERIERAVAERVFPGCVVGIIKEGKRTLIPCGQFTYEVDSPLVTGDTMYDMASVTKSIPLALIALTYLEQGLISLDDKVTTYIPEITIEHANEGLIRHLLTYTYVLKKNPNPNFTYEYATAKDIFEFLFTRDFEFLPGTHYQYSNTGANLLGMILERVSGEKLYSLAEKIVFEPLGLTSSTFHVGDGTSVPPTEMLSWRGEVQGVVHDETAFILQREGFNPGCAGLFSNVGDILTVAQMLLNEGELDGKRYFMPETVLQMHTNQIASIGASAGLGWELNEARFMGSHVGPHTFGKTGFTGTSLIIDPNKDIAVAILSNRTYPTRSSADAINQLRRDISDIVLSTV